MSKTLNLADICEALGGRMERGECVLVLKDIEYQDNDVLELKFKGGSLLVDAYLYPEKMYVPLNVKIWNEEYSKMREQLVKLYWERRRLRRQKQDTTELERKIKDLEKRIEKFNLF